MNRFYINVPCSVGDCVWCITYKGKHKPVIVKGFVEKLTVQKNRKVIVYVIPDHEWCKENNIEWAGGCFSPESCGTSFFENERDAKDYLIGW